MDKQENSIMYYKGNNCKKVNIEFVKNEIAKFLKMDNLNFLIGAGCSSYKESDKEIGIPTMKDLYNGFFDENKEFNIAGAEVKNQFEFNLEKMIESLLAIDVINDTVKEIDNEVKNKIKLVQDYIRNRINKGTNENYVIELYKKFYMKIVLDSRKNPVNIFTTNYDLYNELALDALSFPYNNGFIGLHNRTFNPASYNYMFVENMNLTKNVWNKVPNFFNLYKIHGSITWIKDRGESEDTIRETQLKIIDEDKDVVMIYPTPLKDRSTLMTPYSDLFRAMEIALMKKNSVLITLGYSFSDEHINRLIFNSLAIPSFKLVIIGAGEYINNIIKKNNNRIIVINSEDKIHYFKNFVENAMPEIQDNIYEEFD